MLRLLYRASVLGLLVYCASTLTDIQKRLIVLHALAECPPRYITPPYAQPLLKSDLLSPYVPFVARLKASPLGERLQTLDTSSPASPAETTEPSTPTDTTEPGRWTPTSGELMEGFRLRPERMLLNPESRMSSPTEAGSTEAGSPGPADPELPKHDHESRLACIHTCPAWFAVQKDKILASGHHAVCVPSLRYPMSNCNDHPHLSGEAL